MERPDVMKYYFPISIVLCLAGISIPLGLFVFCVGCVHSYINEKAELGGKSPFADYEEDEK